MQRSTAVPHALTHAQGNIWSLLLFRRRYGPSVGGMVVPLVGGKYFVAEQRQACLYFIMSSLVGAKVSIRATQYAA